MSGEAKGLTPGLHEGLPMEAYLSDPAVSASLALGFHRAPTPAHFRVAELAGGNGSSAAQDLGSAAHDLILEPAEFDRRNVVEPDLPEGYANPRATKAYKEAVAEVEAANPGARVLKAEQVHAVHQMRDNVMAHPSARKLLEADGPVEVIGIWDDPDSGLRLRIRPDKLVTFAFPEGDLGTCVDVKTTRDASLDGWQREVENRGLAFKAAFYRLVLEGLGFPWSDHVCVTAENFAPYLAACRGIHPDWIDMETPNVREALRGIASCRASGRWPGYPGEIEYVNAPAWRLKQVSDLDFITLSEEAA